MVTRSTILTVALLSPALAAAAEPPVAADVRDLRVGEAVAALPAEGYADFTCQGGASIAGWASYRACPPDAQGARRVFVRYDDTPEHATEVAGTPVLLSLVFDDAGVVQAITIDTDPHVRLFQHKRGFMFGLRVKAHYGEAGWSCTQALPASGERPVGTVFVNEHCSKRLGERQLSVDRRLYREAGQAADAFTSATSFTVARATP